jgi:hypothetical protein
MSKIFIDEERRERRKHRTHLRGAIKEAKKKNDKVPLLVKYLRDGIAVIEKKHPKMLAELDLKEHFEMLADLIAPPAKKRGRPKGGDPSERAQAVRTIVALVRRRERDWKKKNPNRPFRGVRRELVAQFFAEPGDDDRFSFTRTITEDEIVDALNRGGSSREIPN